MYDRLPITSNQIRTSERRYIKHYQGITYLQDKMARERTPKPWFGPAAVHGLLGRNDKNQNQDFEAVAYIEIFIGGVLADCNRGVKFDSSLNDCVPWIAIWRVALAVSSGKLQPRESIHFTLHFKLHVQMRLKYSPCSSRALLPNNSILPSPTIHIPFRAHMTRLLSCLTIWGLLRLYY